MTIFTIPCTHCRHDMDWCEECLGSHRLVRFKDDSPAPTMRDTILGIAVGLLLIAFCAISYSVWANWQALWNW